MLIKSSCHAVSEGQRVLKDPGPPCEDELMWNVSEDHALAKDDT